MIKLPIVRKVDHLDTTPASVYESGVIVVNPPYFDHLSDGAKAFILHHEQAHYVFNDYEDDFLADRYAFDQIVEKHGTGAAFEAIEVLNTKGSIKNSDRFAEIYKLILSYRYKKTGEQKYMDELISFSKKYEAMNNIFISDTGVSFSMPDWDGIPGGDAIGSMSFPAMGALNMGAGAVSVVSKPSEINFPYLQTANFDSNGLNQLQTESGQLIDAEEIKKARDAANSALNDLLNTAGKPTTTATGGTTTTSGATTTATVSDLKKYLTTKNLLIAGLVVLVLILLNR